MLLVIGADFHDVEFLPGEFIRCGVDADVHVTRLDPCDDHITPRVVWSEHHIRNSVDQFRHGQVFPFRQVLISEGNMRIVV